MELAEDIDRAADLQVLEAEIDQRIAGVRDCIGEVQGYHDLLVSQDDDPVEEQLVLRTRDQIQRTAGITERVRGVVRNAGLLEASQFREDEAEHTRIPRLAD